MGKSRANHSGCVDDLLRRAAEGDGHALEELFRTYRGRLKRMVRLRLNRQIQGRVDESDIVQEAYLEASKRLKAYRQEPNVPFYLWLRHIAGEKLIDAHRRHLGARMRDAGREVSLHRGPMPAATTAALAAQLLGRLTSPSQAAVKAEMRVHVQEALDSLEPMDREVLVLRHFEQLNGAETAQVLRISKTAASSRYFRAVRRLKETLASYPELFEK